MAESEDGTLLRARRCTGSLSARVSKCSSGGNPSSSRHSFASTVQSVDTDEMDEVKYCDVTANT